MYYKRFSGIIFTYDVTKRETFDDIDRYLKSLNKSGNTNWIKILCGNKIDISENREVSTEEGMNKAEENDMLFFETSAKELINIDEIFSSLMWRINDLLNNKEELNTQKINTWKLNESKDTKSNWY